MSSQCITVEANYCTIYSRFGLYLLFRIKSNKGIATVSADDFLSTPYDIVAVGFEEIVDLDAKNILNARLVSCTN